MYDIEFFKKKFPMCNDSTIGLFAEIAENKVAYRKKSIKQANAIIEVKILRGDFIISFQ